MIQECGPEFAEKYLGWLPRYKACSRHDKRYELVKVKNEIVRAKIDKVFYYQMIVEKPYNKITPKIYYTLVRLFGWIIFYKTKNI